MGEITASKKTAKKVAKIDAIPALTARINELERKVKILTDMPEFVANETRNLFGFGAVAVIFDAIAEKLNKIGK